MKTILFILSTLLLFTSCKKEETFEPAKPFAHTVKIENIPNDIPYEVKVSYSDDNGSKTMMFHKNGGDTSFVINILDFNTVKYMIVSDYEHEVYKIKWNSVKVEVDTFSDERGNTFMDTVALPFDGGLGNGNYALLGIIVLDDNSKDVTNFSFHKTWAYKTSIILNRDTVHISKVDFDNHKTRYYLNLETDSTGYLLIRHYYFNTDELVYKHHDYWM